MGIGVYLAMTAAEICRWGAEPGRRAWMACHFSPYTRGLSNLPKEAGLPIVILNDYTPIQGHDPHFIAAQLESLDCEAVLLDFQRPGSEEAAALAEHLTQTLSCPVGISEAYARNLSCPIFLPPPRPSEGLANYLSPWRGREVWLELALSREALVLTQEGCQAVPMEEIPAGGFCEEALHCHYRSFLEPDAARFSLWRTGEDLKGLLAQAQSLGVTKAIGLWQELGGLGIDN